MILIVTYLSPKLLHFFKTFQKKENGNGGNGGPYPDSGQPENGGYPAAGGPPSSEYGAPGGGTNGYK